MQLLLIITYRNMLRRLGFKNVLFYHDNLKSNGNYNTIIFLTLIHMYN